MKGKGVEWEGCPRGSGLGWRPCRASRSGDMQRRARAQNRDSAADRPDASTPRYAPAAGELARLDAFELLAVNDCASWWWPPS